MNTRNRIRKMKEIYVDLNYLFENSESTIIGIKKCEDEYLRELLFEDTTLTNEFINSLSEIDKGELVKIIIDLMDNPMCRYIITKQHLEK